MGEAKRRKESEPTFGRIPKSEGKRGIVISPGYRSFGPNGFSVDTSTVPILLRQCLLYWDRIEWPDNNLVSIGGGPDTDFLISTGVLQRTRIAFHGAFSGDLTPVFAQGQLRAFENLERQEPGMWSIAQANDALIFSGQNLPQQRSLEVQFYDALPTVPESTPFADILEFKSRYRPELLALRAYMDSLYSTLIQSPDMARSRAVIMDQIAKAVLDLEKALKGSNLPVFKSSLSIDIKLDDLAIKAAGGAVFAEYFGAPKELGAAIGAAIGMFRIQLVSTRTPLLVKTGPFAYLYRAVSELR